MNWLYPSFLRKIDHYLKINYPHIWRTRVHDFGWFSLIIGNAIAIILGILLVGYDSIPNEGDVSMMRTCLMVLSGFVVLFWAIRLLRFKMKFLNFKTMLTTWLIYVLCVASLGFNLVVFTTSIAYKTSGLYPDSTVNEQHNYLSNGMIKYKKDTYLYDGEDYHLESSGNSFLDKTCYNDEGYLRDKCRTEELLEIMSEHGYRFGATSLINRKSIDDVNARLYRLMAAKNFVQQPILMKTHRQSDHRSFYHDLLQMQWVLWVLMLLFLPSVLFLLSQFGVRNVLVSAFSTALLAGLTIVVVDSFRFSSGFDKGELVLMAFMFYTFILMLVLIISKQRLQSWNYIAGAFMLMLGTVFLALFVLQVEYYKMFDYVLVTAQIILLMSLTVSLLFAWMIAQQNEQPVLN